MSKSIKLYNQVLPSVFNPQDFTSSVYIPTLVTDSQTVTSNLTTTNSDIIQIKNADGSTSTAASKTYVDNSISNLISGASDSYNTLKEIEIFLKNDDNLISGLTSSLSLKANQSDLYITNTYVNANTGFINDIYNNRLPLKANQTDLNSATTRISSLENKTNGFSYNSGTNTMTINSKLNVALDDQLNGNTTIGDQSTDILTVNATTTFNNNVNGLTKNTVGLGNVDNTSDVNKPLSTATTNALALKANQTDLNTTNSNVTSNTNSITSLQSSKANQSDLNTTNSNVTSNTNSINSLLTRIANDEALIATKADKSSTLYSNTYYVNAGQNLLSSVLTSIGTNQGQSIQISAGTINDTSGMNITVPNLTIFGPDSAFSSPSTVINGVTTVSGSQMTRLRYSNVQFTNDFIINGTQGRHNFKACTFNANFTLQNTTTNWVFFYYCTFSAQVNIPNTFGGYVIFYFCDFNGATLNLNNLSNQQAYFNSCVNLPSLSLNGLLNGFNTTTTTSSINSVSLNVSGSTSFPSGSISSSSINNTSFVDLSNNQTVNGTKTINNLLSSTKTQGNNSTAVATTAYVDTGLATKQNTLVFDSTPTTASTNIVNSGNIKSYVDTSISNLVASAPSTLDTLNELAAALGNDANFSTTVATQIGNK